MQSQIYIVVLLSIHNSYCSFVDVIKYFLCIYNTIFICMIFLENYLIIYIYANSKLLGLVVIYMQKYSKINEKQFLVINTYILTWFFFATYSYRFCLAKIYLKQDYFFFFYKSRMLGIHNCRYLLYVYKYYFYLIDNF